MWQTVNIAQIRLCGCITPDETEGLPCEILRYLDKGSERSGITAKAIYVNDKMGHTLGKS